MSTPRSLHSLAVKPLPKPTLVESSPLNRTASAKRTKQSGALKRVHRLSLCCEQLHSQRYVNFFVEARRKSTNTRARVATGGAEGGLASTHAARGVLLDACSPPNAALTFVRERALSAEEAGDAHGCHLVSSYALTQPHSSRKPSPGSRVHEGLLTCSSLQLRL